MNFVDFVYVLAKVVDATVVTQKLGARITKFSGEKVQLYLKVHQVGLTHPPVVGPLEPQSPLHAEHPTTNITPTQPSTHLAPQPWK